MTQADTGLQISLIDLPRAAGSLKHVELDVPAPADLGVELIGVPTGSPLHVSADLTAVEGGIYVSGSVRGELQGQCARCLRDIREGVTRELSDLAYYPERRIDLIAEGDEDAEDRVAIQGEVVDLEPMIRDAIVVELPFQPLCRPDCGGLCPVCGQRLDDLPADHHHEAPAITSDILDELEAQLRNDHE